MGMEFRFDPLRRYWVVISPKRAWRPNDFETQHRDIGDPAACPFCEGNEAETPPEVLAVRPHGSAPDGPGWSVRVVPNLFPAFLGDPGAEPHPPGAYRAAPARGYHEVVIESTRHDAELADYSAEHALLVLSALRERVRAIAHDGAVRDLLLFRNTGPRAGASLRHPHTQLVAMHEVPRTIETELAGIREHRRAAGRCLLCDLVAVELQEGTRVLERAGGFASYLPYAGRIPCEIFVAPVAHPPPFADLSDAELADFCALLVGAIRRLKAAFRDPPYNFLLHALVRSGELPDGHHWRAEILPRRGQFGGFELGTGMFINSLPPEEAVLRLRAAAP
ncbi:MAG: DUF4931 domain-containing protein [Planctomycetes bacterium]|nr:DUF4931 domain-containing protein [Planctomycetota bacterium]